MLAPEDGPATTSYRPSIKETPRLMVYIAVTVEDRWEWRRLVKRAEGYTEAKKIAQEYIDKHHPRGY